MLRQRTILTATIQGLLLLLHLYFLLLVKVEIHLIHRVLPQYGSLDAAVRVDDRAARLLHHLMVLLHLTDCSSIIIVIILLLILRHATLNGTARILLLCSMVPFSVSLIPVATATTTTLHHLLLPFYNHIHLEFWRHLQRVVVVVIVILLVVVVVCGTRATYLAVHV